MNLVVGRVAGIPPARPLPRASELVTPALIESEIIRLSNLLEAMTDTLARAAEDEAHAEATFKGKQADELLQSGKSSAGQREAEALTKCKAEYRAYLAAQATKYGLAQKCATVRVQLDSLRTLAANLRSVA